VPVAVEHVDVARAGGVGRADDAADQGRVGEMGVHQQRLAGGQVDTDLDGQPRVPIEPFGLVHPSIIGQAAPRPATRDGRWPR